MPAEIRIAPVFDGPALPPIRPTGARGPRAVLDPFAVYVLGEHVLRGQLLALSADQLSNVIAAYELGDPVPANSLAKDIPRRVEAVITTVRQRVRVA
jgi:hypothetical protein